jgi:hypothetical protein
MHKLTPDIRSIAAQARFSHEQHTLCSKHRKPVSYWFLYKAFCLLLLLFVVYKGVVAWRAVEEGTLKAFQMHSRFVIATFCLFLGRKWIIPLSRALPWRVSMALAVTLLCMIANKQLDMLLHALFGELLTLVSSSWCVTTLWVAGVFPAVHQLWHAATPFVHQLRHAVGPYLRPKILLVFLLIAIVYTTNFSKSGRS